LTVSSVQIQSMLKTYHRNRLWVGKHAKGRVERWSQRDRVEIPVEGGKRRICQKAANQVIDRLTRFKNKGASTSEESQ
jgi:hypothetical protein